MNKENYKNYPEALTIACMYKIDAIERMYSDGCFVDELAACREELLMYNDGNNIFIPGITSAFESAYNFPDNINEYIIRKWWERSDMDDYEQFKSML